MSGLRLSPQVGLKVVGGKFDCCFVSRNSQSCGMRLWAALGTASRRCVLQLPRREISQMGLFFLSLKAPLHLFFQTCVPTWLCWFVLRWRYSPQTSPQLKPDGLVSAALSSEMLPSIAGRWARQSPVANASCGARSRHSSLDTLPPLTPTRAWTRTSVARPKPTASHSLGAL
jgi:hypothetical protein